MQPFTNSTVLPAKSEYRSAAMPRLRKARSAPVPLSVLTPLEEQRFASEGYLVLPAFCSAELPRVYDLVYTLFQKRIGHDEGRQFDMLGLDTDAAAMKQPQIINPSVLEPELLRTEHFQRVSLIARQLLGPDAQFSFDHSILKPAHSRAATPWHQDEAHHNHRFFRYRQISFWMPLQDTPQTSGCMRYIPRSHLGPVLPHRYLNDDPRIHAMECPGEYFEESAVVVRPVAAGTCILHDGRTLHGALPNQSAEERMAYIIAFVGPPQPNEAARLTRGTPASNPSKPSSSKTSVPANLQRRHQWMLRGGFLTALVRRIRQGMRSPPKILFMKLRLLARRTWQRV